MNVTRAFGVIGLATAAFARFADAASPAEESNARLLAQVEPRIRSICETDEFRMRSFRTTWLPDSSGYLKWETPEGACGPVSASEQEMPAGRHRRNSWRHGSFGTYCARIHGSVRFWAKTLAVAAVRI